MNLALLALATSAWSGEKPAPADRRLTRSRAADVD